MVMVIVTMMISQVDDLRVPVGFLTSMVVTAGCVSIVGKGSMSHGDSTIAIVVGAVRC